MKGQVAASTARMPAWAARNMVWGRGKGPVPGCPLAWDEKAPADTEPVEEPPEPFTRVPEPQARPAKVVQIDYDV